MRKLTKKQIEFARKEFAVVEANILESGGKRRAARNEFELQTALSSSRWTLDATSFRSTAASRMSRALATISNPNRIQPLPIA